MREVGEIYTRISIFFLHIHCGALSFPGMATIDLSLHYAVSYIVHSALPYLSKNIASHSSRHVTVQIIKRNICTSFMLEICFKMNLVSSALFSLDIKSVFLYPYLETKPDVDKLVCTYMYMYIVWPVETMTVPLPCCNCLSLCSHHFWLRLDYVMVFQYSIHWR